MGQTCYCLNTSIELPLVNHLIYTTRSWSSWRRPYWTTNLTGTRSRPTTCPPSLCPDPLRTRPADTSTPTARPRNCSVSVSVFPQLHSREEWTESVIIVLNRGASRAERPRVCLQVRLENESSFYIKKKNILLSYTFLHVSFKIIQKWRNLYRNKTDVQTDTPLYFSWAYIGSKVTQTEDSKVKH